MGFFSSIFGGSGGNPMEKFYSKYFEDENKEDSNHFLGHQEFQVTNEKMNEGIAEIGNRAENMDVSVSKLASYCFQNLLIEGLSDLISADQEIYSYSSDLYSTYVENGDDGLLKKAESEYHKPMNKLKTAEIIASEYGIGESQVEIAERNMKRIKERQQEFDDIINSMNGEEAKQAFKQLIATMKDERNQISNEIDNLRA